jgi:hypothetical protein
MIEEIEEQIKSVNMLLVISRTNGDVIKLSKVVDEDEVVTVLYIPQIDTGIYGVNVGESYDGTLFRRFSFTLREDEDYLLTSILDDFLNSGWSTYYQERLDFRQKN